uniref:CSON012000 protein n=1 Tax=Culicoides sonorensis TaxID=179676 RepID=A0A336KIP9_CULSO
MAPVTSNMIQTARKNATSEVMDKHQEQKEKSTNLKDLSSDKTSNIIVSESTEPTIPQQKSNKIPLNLVNAHITCSICKGYLIDATTLVECLHSFCHSCIMKHLRIQDYCPKCDVLVNKAKLNIKPDTTLQAIVYKLVPELYEKELLRRRAFYKMCPKEAALATPDQRGEDTENLIFSPKEALSLSLEFAEMGELPKKSELRKPIYLQCPAIFKISNLKKFVLSKFGIDGNMLSIEIMYKVKTIVLPDHYTLMDVAYIYIWKRDMPMRFFFRVVKNAQPAIKVEPKDEQSIDSKDIKYETNMKNDDKNEIIKSDIKKELPEIKSEKNNNSVTQKIINYENMNQNTKHESIKLKIELSKQGNMVSILKSGAPIQNKTDNNNKSVVKKSDDKTKKDDNQRPAIPKLLLLKPKTLKNSHETQKDILSKIKLKEMKAKFLKEQKLKNKKLDMISAKLIKLSHKSANKTFSNKKVTSSPSTTVQEIDLKKSEFLNTFQLAPRKIVPSSPSPLKSIQSLSSSSSPQKPLRPIAPKSNVTVLKPLSTILGSMSKRKNKEPSKMSNNNNNGASNSNKKLKPTDLKNVVEKIIREKSTQNTTNEKKETISFNLAPFPIGSSNTEISSASSLPLLSTTSVLSSCTSTTPTTSTTTSQLSVNKMSSSPTINNGLSSPVNIINKAQSNVSNSIKSNNSINNVNSKELKRSASPSSVSDQPVFKKPMIVAKRQNTTPEKPKTDNKLQKHSDLSKKSYGPVPNFTPIAPHNMPFTPPHKPISAANQYLNFALMNSSKNMGQLPMQRPIFSGFSPVYAPNSPQYTPNFNITARPQFKYTNPQAYASLVDQYKKNDLFPSQAQNNPLPKPISPVSTPKSPNTNSFAKKSPNSVPLAKKSPNANKSPSPQLPTKPITPPHTFSNTNSNNTSQTTKNYNPNMKTQENLNSNNKRPNANSLLDKLNFPSSLSVTLTTDTDDSRTNSPNNKNHSSVNNYIEIVKLPESPTNNNSINNSNTNNNGATNIGNGNKTPPGCISPPKTIIKIDDVKKMGENVHKDIINKVNEMCAAAANTGGNNSLQQSNNNNNNNNKSPKNVTHDTDNKLVSVPPKPVNGKETFQTKFLESILPILNGKSNENDKSKSPSTVTKPQNVTRTYSKANPIVNQNESSPDYSKVVQSKLDELRKISPKPPQPKPNDTNNKTSQVNSQSPKEKSQKQPISSPNHSSPNYPTYDQAKLASIFNDFARASQNPMQNMFQNIAPSNPMTPFNSMPNMVNFMQQAYLMEQWKNLQHLQNFQKTVEQNYRENIKQNNNNSQTSSNRLE